MKTVLILCGNEGCLYCTSFMPIKFGSIQGQCHMIDATNRIGNNILFGDLYFSEVFIETKLLPEKHLAPVI